MNMLSHISKSLIPQLQMLKLTVTFCQNFLHDSNNMYVNTFWCNLNVLNSKNNIQDSLLSEGMNSINHGVYVRGTNNQLEYDFYGNLFDIIQLEYTGFPIMKLVLFKYDWFDITPNIGTKVDNKYEIVEVRESRRYNKAYDSFIFAQQAKPIYYTLYPKGHHDWLVVIKTKTISRIIHNILSHIEQEAPYHDDDFVGLQVVLHIDLYVINKPLVEIDGGGEEVDKQLLDQTEFDEPNKDEYITIESESESDFNDTDTS
ncbi:hypothetical protein CR513_50114, partial [Mucuna pruriens]